ncbi:MAG: WD40/YVTN/BNR-like repeat-containing protein [Janthinobacterium lividum]
MKSWLPVVSTLSFLALIPLTAHAQAPWLPYGPDGGDARAFASDPHDHNHVYLGTVSGTIYDSHDGGQSWKRLARVGNRDDLVLDNIVVDAANSNHVMVGGWVLSQVDGGLYVSNDGGKTWAANSQLKGHSIRALTAAPSDPKTLVLGALDGVYRSTDGGSSWALISPEGSHELHEIESIAIDPKDPKIIYAGTWHLPWKTTDGGTKWANMKEGIIDDSDVFSIIVDPSNAQNIYLSACSGIYRSVDQGTKFTKVQGIPSTARRTRVLMEDAKQTGTVFAGTTEGLWRTTDSGHTFTRNGNPGWIINDVNIDPENNKRVLLATDRTGVLLSNDGGVTFSSSNKGFSTRQISAVTQDRSNPEKIYVGVINDKAAGGVFASADGGLTWEQTSKGLGGSDIFSLTQTGSGTLLAGTRHGIFRLNGDTWQTSGLTLPLAAEEVATSATETPRTTQQAARAKANTNPVAKGRTAVRSSSEAPVRTRAKRSPSVSTAPVRTPNAEESSTGVFALASSDNTIFAGTEDGLLASTDDGKKWNHIRSASNQPWRVVNALGSKVVLADLRVLSLSTDKGATFHNVTPPQGLTRVEAAVLDGAGHIWVGGREGVWYSDNDGADWKTQQNLFVPDVSGIFFDQAGQRVFITSNQPDHLVFTVHLPDGKVTYRNAGWALRGVRPVGDHLVGLTPFDGVVLQPRMVDSAMAAGR